MDPMGMGIHERRIPASATLAPDSDADLDALVQARMDAREMEIVEAPPAPANPAPIFWPLAEEWPLRNAMITSVYETMPPIYNLSDGRKIHGERKIQHVKTLHETGEHVSDALKIGALREILQYDRLGLLDDVDFLLNRLDCPVNDDTADTQPLLLALEQNAFDGQLAVVRKLLNAGARHDGAATIANSKFDALWDMILASA